jgi:DNA repair protein RadA/Sms
LKKLKTTYVCQNCGAQYAKQQGKCSSCNAWNTIVEEVVPETIKPAFSWEGLDYNKAWNLDASYPKPLQAITDQVENRILCPDKEFNRTLGGGIVPGSLVLIGGEPGIGKSTLLLQIALSLSNQKVLYVSGEESEAQIKMRANRMSLSSSNCYILNETSLNHILQQVAQLKPAILIIDSIQTLYMPQAESAPGSVAQVRMCTAALMHYAKSTHTPVFLIGHITKEGSLAGPKVLEHMVDTVLQFEGDRHLAYRIVRTIKNRFGATSELGIYEMRNNGLREVTNPSELLLSQRENILSGIAIGAFLEGNRSLLIEVQALVSPATYGTPQRATTGFDSKRLNMLLAVLEKRAGLRLGIQDVFLNIAGGLKVEDPALDLAVCLAIASSLQDQAIPQDSCFAAEVGLGGEIRGVNRIEQRIIEAARLGFKQIFISKYNQKELDAKDFSIVVQPVATIQEAISYLKRTIVLP